MTKRQLIDAIMARMGYDQLYVEHQAMVRRPYMRMTKAKLEALLAVVTK